MSAPLGVRMAVLRLLGATLQAGLTSPFTPCYRLLRALRVTAVAAVPKPLAARLVGVRDDPTRRPSAIEAVVDAFQTNRPALPMAVARKFASRAERARLEQRGPEEVQT